MVDAFGRRGISSDPVDRLSVYHECPAGMAARSMGTWHQLVVRPESVVLDSGHIQDVRMADDAGGDLAYALGAAVAKKRRRLIKDLLFHLTVEMSDL